MTATVLSGSSNVSYTNSTGQNVRVIINYMGSPTAISWSGVSVTNSSVLAIGRNLAFNNGTTTTGITMSSNNGTTTDANEASNFAFPTEIMLAAGQTFSATCGAYNVVVIPEAG